VTLFYLDVETEGEDPQQDQIVTVQYQPLTDALQGIGEVQILAEWEWGEKQIVQAMKDRGLFETTFDFTPVGNRLRFDIGFLVERGMKHDVLGWDAAAVRYYFFRKPMLDLTPLLILMNRGRFKGSGLQTFVPEKKSGARVPVLYREGRYRDIIAYVQEEARLTLDLFREVGQVLGTFGDRKRTASGEG
jgi:hypothetical protein